jgi:hypothetical protein
LKIQQKFLHLFMGLAFLFPLPRGGWADMSHPALKVAYAPDVVAVDRLFMVAAKTEGVCTDIRAASDDGITLIDYSRKADLNNIYRFYFRASTPSEKANITIIGCGNKLNVPISVWSFEDLRTFRTLKGIQLPRRWPLGKVLPELKRAQTVTTTAEATALKGKPGRAAVWLRRSDDDIWAMQPDSTIPRWHWVNLSNGCPIHGTEIYRSTAYYPWKVDLSWPWKWKIKCPIGGETYPSNDFAHGDMTSGQFPDDGIGGGCLHDGKRYYFIAQIAQAYAHEMLRVAPECAEGYLATGALRYAHKALVALCRLGVEHAYLATMTQHRHRNSISQAERFGPAPFSEGPSLLQSGLTVYGVDEPRYQRLHAEAYNRIFPAIDKDAEIIPFLQKKGFRVSTHEDVRRFLEENLFATWMQATIDGSFQSNEPWDQRGFAHVAEVLNYRSSTDFMDWLYDGAGRMRVILSNTFFRDGAPFEATGVYNGAHVSGLGPVIDSIEHMRSLQPSLYPEARYPILNRNRRYHNIFDLDMDTVTIDRSYPSVGDDGDYQGYSSYTKLPMFRSWQSGDAKAYENAYRNFGDPKFAWALINHQGWLPSTDFPLTRHEIAEAAKNWSDGWSTHSSLHDGYGLSILRGGTFNNKRALWLYYGHTREHGHDDIMDIGLQGFEGVLLSHLGYPRNWGNWESSWMTHHVARQIPFQTMTGQPQLFADVGPVHLAEIRAQSYVDGVDAGKGYSLISNNWQDRSIVLVDVDADRFYGVDLYQISGGKEHWWSFHAQQGDFATQGVTLNKQIGGTLAGPDVPYGDQKWLKGHSSSLRGDYGWFGPWFGFPHLYNVEHGQSEGPWSADWLYNKANDMHLRLTVMEGKNMEVSICDGKSPVGGSPYEMKWILLHKKGIEPVRSLVASIIEPYMKTPIIQAARPIKLSIIDGDALSAQGYELHLGHRTDTLLFSTGSNMQMKADSGLRFAGRFGFYSEEEDRPLNMVLVDGTYFSKNGFEIKLDKPEYLGRIDKIDRINNVITISPAPPDPDKMRGAYIFVTSSNRRSAYKVQDVTIMPEGVQVHLDLDPCIGRGRVTGIGDFRVLTSTPFPLHRFRYYHGARLANEDRSAEYSLLEVRDKTAAIIDAEIHPGARNSKIASEFPVGSLFEVYDYGIGDSVVWPYTVSMVRVAADTYQIDSPIGAHVTVPNGVKVVRQTIHR